MVLAIFLLMGIWLLAPLIVGGLSYFGNELIHRKMKYPAIIQRHLPLKMLFKVVTFFVLLGVVSLAYNGLLAVVSGIDLSSEVPAIYVEGSFDSTQDYINFRMR